MLCQLSGWLCFSQGNESLTQLLLLHPWYWFLISHPGMRSGHQGGPRLGSRLLFCFLPFMAVMDFLCFPPFPLLLYRCDHYVVRGKWISRQRLSLPPLCHPFVCLQNQTHCAEVFNCCVCFSNVVWAHGISKPWQAGELLSLSPTFSHLQQTIERDFWMFLATPGWDESAFPWRLHHNHSHFLPLNVACGQRHLQSQGSGVTNGCTSLIWSKCFGEGIRASATHSVQPAGTGVMEGLIRQADTCSWQVLAESTTVLLSGHRHALPIAPQEHPETGAADQMDAFEKLIGSKVFWGLLLH